MACLAIANASAWLPSPASAAARPESNSVTIGLNTQCSLELSARLLVATLRHLRIARQALHIRQQVLRNFRD